MVITEVITRQQQNVNKIGSRKGSYFALNHKELTINREDTIKKKKRNLTSRAKARLKKIHPENWKDYYTFITAKQFIRLAKEPCYICGRKLKISLTRDDGGTFTVDHKKSLGDGGKHEIDNLRACCHRCNQEKS